MLEVTDDSGFLAVVVPATYHSFVACDWDFQQLLNHFHQQMPQQSLLIWGTGREGTWNVDVRFKPSAVDGFREVSGPIRIEGESVLVTNYESLTMAAQFEDVRLPDKPQEHLVLTLPDGRYKCRIVQMFDPENQESAEPGNPDFVVELCQAPVLPKPWSDVPWFSAK